jgi:hypothetical protein
MGWARWGIATGKVIFAFLLLAAGIGIAELEVRSISSAANLPVLPQRTTASGGD